MIARHSTLKALAATALVVLLATATVATRQASAQTILQYGFDFTSGTVESQGGTVADDSGNFNFGQMLVGNGGTYTSDIPTNTQFTTGIGSLDVSGNNSIGTDPTGQTNAGTGLLAGGGFLDFSTVVGAGGLTVEVWGKNLAPGEDEELGQVVSVGAVYGLMVDSTSRVRAFNGFAIDETGSAIATYLTSDWTHLAAVYSNPVLEDDVLTVDVALYINGTLADSHAGSVIPLDFQRGAGVGNNAVAAVNPEAANGLVYEPSITLGALAPNEFTITTPIPLPEIPTLRIDRDTGAMNLIGGDSNLAILGYSVQSAGAGALDPDAWTTVTGNYDVNGNKVVDNADPWEVLSEPGDNTDLREGEVAGGNAGGVISAGANLDLGNAWIQGPVEDIAMYLALASGQIFQVPVEFVGNDGEAFRVGDLNFDGEVDRDDWPIYRAGIRADLTDLSPAEAYQMGDLNNDGLNDTRDFLLFRAAFEGTPGASFADLASVPEPSGVGLMILGTTLAGLWRRRTNFTRRTSRIALHRRTAHMSFRSLALCGVAMAILGASAARAVVVSVDFQTGVPGFAANMVGVEPNAATADAVFQQANVWNIATLQSHYSVPGSVDHNPSWFNLVDSTGVATTATFSITGDVIGTDVITLGQNELNEDGLFFDASIASSELSWQISGLTPLSPFKLYLNQLDVATWLGAPQNRAMKGFIDTNGDGTADEPYQMDFPGVLVTGTVAADGIVRGTSVRAATGTSGATEPDWGGFQIATEIPLAPDPLTLVVNTTTGQITLSNPSDVESFDIDYYEILSDDSLDVSGWSRLAGKTGFPAGDGSGNGWEDAGTPDANFLGEIFLDGPSAVAAGASLDLGSAYNEGLDARDLVFQYLVGDHLVAGDVTYFTPSGLAGDFNADGIVDAADYLVWRNNFGAANETALNNNGNGGGIDATDYLLWKGRYGDVAEGSLLAVQNVPEPGSLALLLSFAVCGLAVGRRCRRSPANH